MGEVREAACGRYRFRQAPPKRLRPAVTAQTASSRAFVLLASRREGRRTGSGYESCAQLAGWCSHGRWIPSTQGIRRAGQCSRSECEGGSLLAGRWPHGRRILTGASLIGAVTGDRWTPLFSCEISLHHVFGSLDSQHPDPEGVRRILAGYYLQIYGSTT